MRICELIIESNRPKTLSQRMGPINAIAIRAAATLSSAARIAVESWNINWSTGQLNKAFVTNSPVAQEITQAFEPVRQALKREFGDTISMHRGQRKFSDKNPPSHESRALFSWTIDPELAQRFGQGRMSKPISDQEIDQAVDQYNRTGYLFFGGIHYVRNKHDPEYYNMYDRNRNSITDGDDLEADLRDRQNSRNERNQSNVAAGDVYTADIPVDKIVWIPVGANLSQQEFIVRQKP